jgi:hypothetical protein
MELETEPLPAGTYVIKVYYYSLYEVSPASSQLILFYAGNQIPITMTAIEIGTHSFF